MEHIKKEKLPNGYFRLTPDTGYLILDTRTRSTYTVVETKTARYFKAIGIPVMDDIKNKIRR